MLSRPFPSGAVLLTLVALALLLYAPVLGLSFFSDDFSVIHRIGVQGDLGTGSFFRPLPDWTLYLNYLIAGPTPWAFRIVNVALLGVNAWLVYHLGRNLFNDSARWSPALIAALLFICYPFHSEPQLWIIGRSTAMATLFTLAALVTATSSTSSINKCIVVGLCGALGAMCYELALLLPLLIVPLMFAAPKGDRRTWWGLVLISSAVAGANLFLRSMLTGHVANAYGTSFFVHDIGTYFAMSAKVCSRLFLPPNEDARVQTICAAILLLLLVAIAFLVYHRTRGQAADQRSLLVLACLIGVACALGIVGGVSTRTSESDRFLYLPSAFLCLLIAFAFNDLRAWRWRTAATVTLITTWLFFLFGGQIKWILASKDIERIVAELPPTPPTGRLVVMGLPGDNQGAFMFRHGFREALLFAGRDTTRIIIRDSLHFELGDEGMDLFIQTADDTLALGPADRIVSWSHEKGFIDTP